MNRSPKRRNRLMLWAALLVATWLLASYAVAHRLTRRARARHDEPLPVVPWGQFQPLRLATADGETLGAWFLDAAPKRPVVLLLHGNTRCRSTCLSEAELLATAGYAVLMPSLRAHGDSTGDFNDIGYSARHDVLAAIAWLEEHHSDRPIVIWGQSLGSAAALFAAGELGERVRGYVLESPYQNLRTAVWNRMNVFLPIGLDYLAYAGLMTVSPLILPNVDRISPLDAAATVPPSLPVLVLAGNADRRARLHEAEAIRVRVSGPTELVIIEGGDHGHLMRADASAYRSAVLGFLGKAAGGT